MQWFVKIPVPVKSGRRWDITPQPKTTASSTDISTELTEVPAVYNLHTEIDTKYPKTMEMNLKICEVITVIMWNVQPTQIQVNAEWTALLGLHHLVKPSIASPGITTD